MPRGVAVIPQSLGVHLQPISVQDDDSNKIGHSPGTSTNGDHLQVVSHFVVDLDVLRWVPQRMVRVERGRTTRGFSVR